MYLYDLWKGRSALSENMNAHIVLYSVGDFMTAPQKFCIQPLGCCSFYLLFTQKLFGFGLFLNIK